MRFFLHQIVIVLLLGVFCYTGGQSALAAGKSAAQKKAEYRAKVREEAKEKALREARESVMGVTPAMVQNAIAGGIEFILSEDYQGDRVAATKGEYMLMYFVNGVIDEVLDEKDESGNIVRPGLYTQWIEKAKERVRELEDR